VEDVVVAERRRMKKSWVLGISNMVPTAIWWGNSEGEKSTDFSGQSYALSTAKHYLLRMS